MGRWLDMLIWALIGTSIPLFIWTNIVMRPPESIFLWLIMMLLVLWAGSLISGVIAVMISMIKKEPVSTRTWVVLVVLIASVIVIPWAYLEWTGNLPRTPYCEDLDLYGVAYGCYEDGQQPAEYEPRIYPCKADGYTCYSIHFGKQ